MRYCVEPGCSAKVRKGRCAKHGKHDHRRDARERGTAAERGYDRTWQKVRARYLAEHPLCEQCQAEKEIPPLADLVHHIVPLSDGGARLNPANLRSLCNECHAKVHADLERQRR